ncbi:CBS domain-containing protein [Solitalea koreensis]|uniref:CBS domain-containing protein n=1 Tax=Solitalea koreensis TaxID=543615 RepID=A0A521AM38_9SPHI|nr:CBS domain-containing protein [Solitalea koreensis]SMO35720.1 CBS domain-containing protein [Solitalea koreensis]
MLKVKDILERKGTNIYAIDAEETVYDALEMLVEKNIGALVVTDHGRHIGVFTERDYARKVILKGKASRETRVHDIMSDTFHTVSPNEGVEECMELMTRYRVRHLPVEEDDKLVGLISIGDLVKYLMDIHQMIIDDLGHQITDGK